MLLLEKAIIEKFSKSLNRTIKNFESSNPANKIENFKFSEFENAFVLTINELTTEKIYDITISTNFSGWGKYQDFLTLFNEFSKLEPSTQTLIKDNCCVEFDSSTVAGFDKQFEYAIKKLNRDTTQNSIITASIGCRYINMFYPSDKDGVTISCLRGNYYINPPNPLSNLLNEFLELDERVREKILNESKYSERNSNISNAVQLLKTLKNQNVSFTKSGETLMVSSPIEKLSVSVILGYIHDFQELYDSLLDEHKKALRIT